MNFELWLKSKGHLKTSCPRHFSACMSETLDNIILFEIIEYNIENLLKSICLLQIKKYNKKKGYLEVFMSYRLLSSMYYEDKDIYTS